MVARWCLPALSMVNGLVAPDAVYFTSPDDGICWLRVTNEGAAAMEFDSADESFTGQVLTSGGMLPRQFCVRKLTAASRDKSNSWSARWRKTQRQLSGVRYSCPKA